MIRPNESAFPVIATNFHVELGLTKREYIAIMAFQGMLANSDRNFMEWNTYATRSVQAADVLINELNRNGE